MAIVQNSSKLFRFDHDGSKFFKSYGIFKTVLNVLFLNYETLGSLHSIIKIIDFIDFERIITFSDKFF